MTSLIAETDRLRIRKLTTDDADFILRLVNEPSFLENIGDKGVRDLEDAKRFILEGPWAQHGHRGYGQFALELKEDGSVVGVGGLLFREKLDISDLGVAVLPEHWRQGFGYEAALAIMEYGRTELGIDTICGLTSEHNHASIKALEKLGMSYRETVAMSDDDPGTLLYS